MTAALPAAGGSLTITVTLLDAGGSTIASDSKTLTYNANAANPCGNCAGDSPC
jgi:hypothetical protein